MRWLAILCVIAGCFRPKLAEHLACGADGSCPPGQACGADQRCHGPGDTVADATIALHDGAVDATADATHVLPPDASIDAPPVGCQNNADCATPPDPCSLAGSCNHATHMCTFPPVTCTQLDSDCAVGVCDSTNGTCVAMARNESNSCGAGTTCGAFGQCGGFADACDENGSQSRTCTVNTCHAGACVGTMMTDTAACQRGSTDGAACGTQSEINCNACGGFQTTCDETGTQSCTCIQPTCLGGSCSNSTSSACVVGCTRDTDGLSCGTAGHICDTGTCDCPSC